MEEVGLQECLVAAGTTAATTKKVRTAISRAVAAVAVDTASGNTAVKES